MKILESTTCICSFPSESALSAYLVANPHVRKVARSLLPKSAKGEVIVSLAVHASAEEAQRENASAQIRDHLSRSDYVRPASRTPHDALSLAEKRIRRSCRSMGFSSAIIAERIAEHRASVARKPYVSPARAQTPPSAAELI